MILFKLKFYKAMIWKDDHKKGRDLEGSSKYYNYLNLERLGKPCKPVYIKIGRAHV
jgi:hypothetical protein